MKRRSVLLDEWLVSVTGPARGRSEIIRVTVDNANKPPIREFAATLRRLVAIFLNNAIRSGR